MDKTNAAQIQRENVAPASQKRLGEILSVLRRHQITHGLTPVRLREILEDLGPTYVKLGQIMSMRSDMLPENYCRELTKLRTEVKPLPYGLVSRLIEDELKEPVENIFSHIDEIPLGSASIAQVHPAVLKDGRKVVIKIQRPSIREIMKNDISLMKKATGILKLATGTKGLIDFNTILDELWKTSQEEMNFIQEAAKLDGANDFQIWYKVIMPLCTPVIATIALYYAVGQWNSFMDTYLYAKELPTLQYKLYEIMSQATMQLDTHSTNNATQAVTPMAIRMAVTVVATVPIIVVYPFLQKYFVGGMTLGSVKD